MMRNKKAWLRIVEAFIAILLIASVLIILVARAPRQEEVDTHEMQRFILEKVSVNETLRGEILSGERTETRDFIEKIIPKQWNFTVEVCEVGDVCGMPFYVEKEVFADEILISSNLTKYNPKKLKFFVWRK